MATITLRARGRADAAAAWERYERTGLWSRWAPQIRRVETPGGRIVPGLTGTVVAVGGLRVAFTVDSVDVDARIWSWTARLGPLHLQLEHGVEEDPRGSATWLWIRGPLPVIVGYAPVALIALRRLVAA